MHTDNVDVCPLNIRAAPGARWVEGKAAFRTWAERLLRSYQQLRVRTTLLATTPRGLAVRFTMHWQEPDGPVQRVGTLLTRALPVWGEGTLLGPTIAGVVQLFRPPKLARRQSTQPVMPAHATPPKLRGAARRLTLPRPAVNPDPPPNAPAERPS